MQNLTDELVRFDGHADVSEVASVCCYGRPATLQFEAFTHHGFSPPPSGVNVVVEANVGGAWTTVADFGELHDDVVEREYAWDATTPLRVRWEFTQEDSRFWVVVVRLV